MRCPKPKMPVWIDNLGCVGSLGVGGLKITMIPQAPQYKDIDFRMQRTRVTKINHPFNPDGEGLKVSLHEKIVEDADKKVDKIYIKTDWGDYLMPAPTEHLLKDMKKKGMYEEIGEYKTPLYRFELKEAWRVNNK